MLTIYRRHTKRCTAGRPERDRKFRKCGCPPYVEGMLADEYVRERLKTGNWQKASQVVLEAEARGTWGAVRRSSPAGIGPLVSTQQAPLNAPRGITLATAKAKFLSDAEHGRAIATVTLNKYKLMFRHLEEFVASRGIDLLADIDLDTLREFREGWKLGQRTALKKLERVKAFFRFCHESQWIAHNPSKLLRGPANIKDVPKEPFTAHELSAILRAAAKLNLNNGVHDSDDRVTNDDLITFILFLRYSGLRIMDAAMTTIDRINAGRVHIYTQKTGQPVYVPLPPFLVERLKAVRLRHGKYLFTGTRSVRGETAAELWRTKTGRTTAVAGIVGGNPHRFRHTFAVELLLQGVPMENVSILLGHSSIRITEMHYSAWVKSRQDAVEEQVSRTWRTHETVASEST